MYKKHFPFFENNEAIYLDTAATSQKPLAVIDAVSDFYRYSNSNIHRGNYKLSLDASESFEETRQIVASFIHAEDDEIIFTKGATESLNFVADQLLYTLQEGDNVVVTELEHSSAYFPFRRVCQLKKAEFRVVRVNREGKLDEEDLFLKIDQRSRLLSVTAMSNVNGYKPDLAKIIPYAHKKGCLVCVDATQYVVHERTDMKTMDPDFLVFSSHKLYGPMGVGCLFIKKEHQNNMNPLLLGGGTIEMDEAGGYPLKAGIERFEAGTQNVAGVIGLKSAITYLNRAGMEKISEYEKDLSDYLFKKLSEINRVKVVGHVEGSSVMSLEIAGLSSYDAGVYLSLMDICVRCGGHCAFPMMKALGKENLIRVSLGIYNTPQDIDCLSAALKKITDR